MTSNVNNTGIAHLAFRLGGQALCKNRRAFVCVTDANRMGYQICKRCEGILAKAKDRAARKADKPPTTNQMVAMFAEVLAS